MKQFNIAINGQKAVDAARAFIGTACYRGIYNHGKRIAQVEIVIDEPGTYKGNSNKWVDVTILNQKNIEMVVNQLAMLSRAKQNLTRAIIPDTAHNILICG